MIDRPLLDRRLLLGGLFWSSAALALPPSKLLPPPGGPTLEEIVVEAVPLRLWLPDGMGEASRLVIFSHGANSNAANYDALTWAWAGEGHAVAAVLHADSPDHPGGGKIAREAGWADRLNGMRVAAAELQRRYPGIALVAAGHSYGALVAQALGGARVTLPGDGGAIPMPGVTRIIAFSPPGAIPGAIGPEGWAKIAVPMLVVTGTADTVPMMAPTWQAHGASFDAAPVSPRWFWVGEGVDHYFGNRIGRPERTADPEQARLFDAALGTSVSFLEGRAAPPQPRGATLTER